MRVQEAKDFLVQETAQQAQMEGVTLSDLEKRMMYFTETEEAVEDPAKLNGEFEAGFDSSEYESKISELMRHAYDRVKKENPEKARDWNEAVGKLRKSDHYILLLVDLKSAAGRPPHDRLKLVGASLLVVAVGMALLSAIFVLAEHYHIHWNPGPSSERSVPVWIQRLLLASIVGGYVYYVVLPLAIKRPGVGIGQLISKIFRARSRESTEK